MHTGSDEAEIDLGRLARRIWMGRFWVTASVVVVACVFAAAAFLMTPIYRATTVLIPADINQGGLNGSIGSALGSLGGLASLAGINVGLGSSKAEEALAVLRSREFTERFIKNEGLLPILYRDRWNEEKEEWKGAAEDHPTLAMGHKKFNKIRSIAEDKKTGLVTVNIDWKDREEATLWLNKLIYQLNMEMRARAIGSADASLSYLEKELSATSAIDIRAAINRLVEVQINRRMFANVTYEYAFRVVDAALVPDKKDIYKPNKMMLLISGPIVGFIFGIMIALLARRQS